MESFIQLALMGLILVLGILAILFFITMMKNKTAFQKLNRFTVVAVVLTFLGLLSLNYSLLNSMLGSTLVLFLIRISYVIYVDSE